MIFNIIYITLSILIIALIIFYRSELNHNYHKLYEKRQVLSSMTILIKILHKLILQRLNMVLNDLIIIKSKFKH